jgi:hypothetical protein
VDRHVTRLADHLNEAGLRDRECLPDSSDSPADEPPGCQLSGHGNCGDG